MILVLGGTTEGRKAVKELEEGGNPFYYSTKTGEQDISLHHGIAMAGALDEEQMYQFCRSKSIRLIIDAAHPFASLLHVTVASAAKRLGIPAIRFERVYPPHADDILWCDNYSEIPTEGISSLLATTGVQSIGRLKYLEQQGIKMHYRILRRESSIRLAHQQGATDDQLCFYDGDSDETILLRQLSPDAILLKESGESGNFPQKTASARQLGIKIIALRRPPIDAYFHVVNGEHGLRRMVERLLPDFYPLHSGLTTGTCATAAAIAATIRLLHQRQPSEVGVKLPNGETIPVTVGYGEGYAYTLKDAGDDPDVTDGLEIRANVTLVSPTSEIEISGGDGVGTFTLPGFDFPPGAPAINRIPRKMIADNLRPLLGEKGAKVTISIPDGQSIAQKTFNPRLGITGGLSIIGVSGIVKPFSEQAFIDSIRKCMQIAQASGSERVVINSGAKSERFVKKVYPQLPPQAFVEYGNYIGQTLSIAHQLGIKQVTLGIMMGKAVKLAAGELDTHSRKAVMDKKKIMEMALHAGCNKAVTAEIETMTLARELWQIIPPKLLDTFCNEVISNCMAHCAPLLPNGRLEILLIDETGGIHPTK